MEYINKENNIDFGNVLTQNVDRIETSRFSNHSETKKCGGVNQILKEVEEGIPKHFRKR